MKFNYNYKYVVSAIFPTCVGIGAVSGALVGGKLFISDKNTKPNFIGTAAFVAFGSLAGGVFGGAFAFWHPIIPIVVPIHAYHRYCDKQKEMSFVQK